MMVFKTSFLATVVLFVLFVNTAVSLSFLKKHLYKKAYEEIASRKLEGTVGEAWIEQKLDNFHPTDDRTWYQRYFVEESYSKADGPVFLQIGGEGPISPVWMNEQVHWIHLATKVNALCFQLEHRFYGISQPTKDVSAANLVYLSSEQALADVGNFITTMKKKYSLDPKRKWIVFGGSYPGSLALWARLKYPHLISGAVSSSAPLTALPDFSGYNEVVEHSLNKLGDPKCAERINVATKYLAQLLNSGKYSTVEENFNLCGHITSFDVGYLQQSLADNIADVVQYNRDERSFEASGGKVMNITELCAIMRYNAEHLDMNPQWMLHNYASVNEKILQYHDIKCMDVSYKKFIGDLRNSSWESAPSSREWGYQSCTEFGWYQTSSSSLFRGFPLSYFLRECEMLYGVKVEELMEGIRRTNIMYGGVGVVNQLTNATLYNGLIDPWSNVSYTGKSAYDHVITQVVDDTAHCAIMYPSSEHDSSALVEARKLVEMQLRKWLQN